VNQPRERYGRSKIAIYASVALLSIAGLFSGVLPASAQSGIEVYVGYADFLRADVTTFPLPWAGSPNTIFEGCVQPACTYDAGAVRVVNNTGSPVTVNAVAVHIDSCTYYGWAPAVLQPGADLIVTQQLVNTQTGCPGIVNMDTSDVGPSGSDYSLICSQDHLLPTVDVTINSQTTTYTDAGQVLNTGGIDGACGGNNESQQWTRIGSAPCKGSLLTLSPLAQTHGIGTTATVSASFTNSCQQPLSDVLVSFTALSGPNAGITGTGVTNANGVATFSYTSQKTGTDTLRASVTNLVGTLDSNTVTVTWEPFAPGGGAFVISDLKDINGAHVYWWGAQWWKNDPLSSGLASAAFKGFEKGNLAPACGQTWSARPGNSGRPPRTVPSVMAVIVASHITKKGSTISGDVLHIVLVRTDAGYGPNPGHKGTGTIIAQIC